MLHCNSEGHVLHRREFIRRIGWAAAAGTVSAVEAEEDSAIRDVLRHRVDVGKRTVGMAVCVVTPSEKRLVVLGHERLSNDRLVTPDTIFEIASITKIFVEQSRRFSNGAGTTGGPYPAILTRWDQRHPSGRRRGCAVFGRQIKGITALPRTNKYRALMPC
jgi:hypothetical protein